MKKVTRYIIIYDQNIPNYAYNFYYSFEEAETQRTKLSKTEGKVLKVVIHVDN